MSRPGDKRRSKDTVDVTIDSGASLSSTASLAGKTVVGIEMSDDWDAAALTFQTAASAAANVGDLYDEDGEVEIASGSAVAGGVIGFQKIARFEHAEFVRVRSGTTGSPVNQTADRVITLIVEAIG